MYGIIRKEVDVLNLWLILDSEFQFHAKNFRIHIILYGKSNENGQNFNYRLLNVSRHINTFMISQNRYKLKTSSRLLLTSLQKCSIGATV